MYLCLFWSIEQFLSLFNIFQISGDCFPPLDVAWAPANGNTRRLPAAAGGQRKLRAEMLVKFSFSWADLSPLIITQQSLISLNLAPCVDTCVPRRADFLEQTPTRLPRESSSRSKGRNPGDTGAGHFSLKPGAGRRDAHRAGLPGAVMGVPAGRGRSQGG